MKITGLFSRFILAALVLLSGLASRSYAQSKSRRQAPTYTMIFRGDSIRQALQRLVHTTHINLVYDPAIMTDHPVFATAKKERPESILRQILKNSELDFVQLSSGTYVLTPAPGNAPSFGNLSGWVIDKHTGKPLAGANVMLADATGGDATNESGHFNIPDLKGGYHPVTISYVGYKAIRDTVWIPVDATTSLNFSMRPEPIYVEPIVVEDLQQRHPASETLSQTLQAGQITASNSFGTADAIKSLNAVDGIYFELPSANISIQGGGQGENQLRLDGVPIYNPVDMGQLLGAFSPWAVQKIEIYKAGFGAPVGSQLSGVINVVQQTGNDGDAPLLFQANPQNINGRFEQTFGGKTKPAVHFMIAARGSIWKWAQQPSIRHMLQNWDQLDPLLTQNLFQSDSTDTYFKAQNHAYDINYYDLHAAVNVKHNEFHQTKISAYLGKNLLKTRLSSANVPIPFATPPQNVFYSFDDYGWTNYMARIQHEWLVNARLDAAFSAYITHHNFDHNYVITNRQQIGQNHFLSLDKIQNRLEDSAAKYRETGDRNALTQSSARIKLSYKANKRYMLSGNLRATRLNYRFHLANRYYRAAQTNSNSFLVAGYVQNDFLLSRELRLSLGSRLTFVPSRDLVFAEPRAALTVDAPNTSVGSLTSKLSGGIYRQFINQFDVSNVGPSTLVPSLKFWAPIDYSTAVPKAYHIALNNLWEPANRWKIRLESYYKWIPSRLTLNYNNLSGTAGFEQSAAFSQQQQFISSVPGYAYGAGVSFKKTFSGLNIELKGGYQFSVARQHFPARFGEGYEPVSNNQPHKVDASAHWKIRSKLTFLLNWQGIWGRSWGFRKAYYDYLSARGDRSFGQYSFDDPGDDRLPAYARLNAGLSYGLDVGRSDLSFRLDVFNLLDHENVLNWRLSPYRNPRGTISYRRRERTLTGLRPSLSIKLRY